MTPAYLVEKYLHGDRAAVEAIMAMFSEHVVLARQGYTNPDDPTLRQLRGWCRP